MRPNRLQRSCIAQQVVSKIKGALCLWRTDDDCGQTSKWGHLCGLTLGRFGIPLKAGEVILSGSLVPLEPVLAGDTLNLSIGGLGGCSVRFV